MAISYAPQAPTPIITSQHHTQTFYMSPQRQIKPMPLPVPSPPIKAITRGTSSNSATLTLGQIPVPLLTTGTENDLLLNHNSLAPLIPSLSVPNAQHTGTSSLSRPPPPSSHFCDDVSRQCGGYAVSSRSINSTNKMTPSAEGMTQRKKRGGKTVDQNAG